MFIPNRVLSKKKIWLLASTVILCLAAALLAWLLREPALQPDRVTVHCAGFVTNSAGVVYGSYAISNQSPYAIKVIYYFEGFSGNNVWNGSPIPKTIIEGGRDTTILRPIITKPGLEFYVRYMNYTARARLYDFATQLRINKLLPAKWGRGFAVNDEHCPLCVR